VRKMAGRASKRFSRPARGSQVTRVDGRLAAGEAVGACYAAAPVWVRARVAAPEGW
jgi:hypothetical protein